MKVTLEGFRGAIPQLPPLSLPANHAQVAERCRADEGYLRPLLGTPAWARAPLVKTGDLKGLYRYRPEAGDPASGYLFHWTARTQVAAGFIRGDSQRAVVFTTEGLRPQITDATIASSTTDYPSQAHWLGVPAPSAAPVASLDIGHNNHVLSSPDGVTWATNPSAAGNMWAALCWSPELSLFVAVAYSGIGNRVMTSPDGLAWTVRTSAADNNWQSVCWSSALSLFVAVAHTGVGNRVMTSPDGITWTTRASAADNNWQSVCWSSALSLFVAVATSGTGNRVMTSPDGVNWTLRTSPADNNWQSVCWSSALSLFVAVATSGTGNRVMTSPDGVVWTIGVSAADNSWQSVCWSPEAVLFVAVSASGTGNRVMTSPDGITWTTRTSAADSSWQSVCWSPAIGQFFAVALSGNDGRVMVSPDGVAWTVRTGVDTRDWRAIVWATGLNKLAGLATSSVGDDDDRIDRNYVLIFESYWTTQRFEGPPAQDGSGNILFSNAVSPLPGQGVLVSGLPVAPAGGWNVTHVGIFRLSGSVYRRVTRVPIGTVSYTDTVPEEGLGEVLASADFHPPAEDMHHVGVLSNGMAFGATGSEVAISYPYLIHAWGPNNRCSLGSKVMAAVSMDSTIYALTHENPFIITGQDPRSMFVEEIPIGQGCASVDSVAVSRHGVVYASPEGLFLLASGRPPLNLVEGFFLPEQWRTYKPDSLVCGVHEDWLLAFWDNGLEEGCFVFRLDQPDFGIVSIPDLRATATYSDPLLDSLVIAPPYNGVQNELLLFQRGAAPTLPYKWRSGLLKPGKPACMQAARVWSRDYTRPLTFRLYDQAGVLRHTQDVASERAFRLPGGYRAMAYSVELEGTQEVMRVEMAESLSELNE